MIRNKCLICESENLKKIIDLGMQPFADLFLKKEDLDKSEPTYPLACNLCEDCGQIQTSYTTDPMARYSYYDYSYTMSNSDFSRNHWKQFAKDMIENVDDLKKGDSILEIGSNDGYLLQCFKENGYLNVMGVDPSQKMVDLAKKIGIDTIVDLFPLSDANVDKKLLFIRGAKLVIACNVFNHSEDPVSFVKEVYDIMDNDGMFVFELPYWYKGFRALKFDQIYHEHVSYFTAASSFNILKRCNMRVHKIEVVDYHGGSLRVYAKKGRSEKDCPEIVGMIDKEVLSALFDEKYYSYFMNRIVRQRNKFLKKILEIKMGGDSIIAVGAAAKGNTFLNFYRLDNSLIEYVTDSSLQKQGKFTPLTRIPIVGDEIFSKYNRVYALILSWNISTKLKENLLKLNPNIIFISPDLEEDD